MALSIYWLIISNFATLSNILAWKTLWTKEADRLQPMRSQKVRHDWATEHTHTMRVYHITFFVLRWWLRQLRIGLQCRRPRFDPWVGKIPWGREWLPTPVFLPGEFHGERSLVSHSPWGHTKSDMTEQQTSFISFEMLSLTPGINHLLLVCIQCFYTLL